jgi:hypothetical protein
MKVLSAPLWVWSHFHDIWTQEPNSCNFINGQTIINFELLKIFLTAMLLDLFVSQNQTWAVNLMSTQLWLQMFAEGSHFLFHLISG